MSKFEINAEILADTLEAITNLFIQDHSNKTLSQIKQALISTCPQTDDTHIIKALTDSPMFEIKSKGVYGIV